MGGERRSRREETSNEHSFWDCKPSVFVDSDVEVLVVFVVAHDPNGIDGESVWGPEAVYAAVLWVFVFPRCNHAPLAGLERVSH